MRGSTSDRQEPFDPPRPAWVVHAAALLAVSIATVVRMALHPVLGNDHPFATYFVAVAVVAWFGRTSSALLTLVVGGVLAFVLFAPNQRSVLLGIGLYTMVAGVIVAMSHAMRAARQQTSTHLESVTDGFVRYDRDWRIVYVNAEAERINRMVRADMLGRTLWTLFPAVVGTTLESELRRAMEERVTVEFENRYEPWDRWYALKAYPTPDGGLTTFIRDITENKTQQGELVRLVADAERQRRLYDTVLANTPDLAYVFDLDHRFAYANQALLKMWGRTWDDAIGKTCLELGYEPWHAAMHDREIDRIVATRQPIRGEVAFEGTAGRRQYDYILVPVVGANGDVEAVAGTTRDITDRLHAEERLKANEARQSFLVTLTDTIRAMSDPVAVQAEAARVLGQRLGANRVAYFEIRGDEYVIERDYAAGVRPLAGRYPVGTFGPALLADLLAGRTVIEADAPRQPGRPPAECAAFKAIHVRGHVDVPLVKGGRFVAGMTVQVSEPRQWTAQEIALIEDTAERTWAAVERARVEDALRQSEERSAFVRRSSGVGFWYCDLPFDVLQWDELVKAHFHLPPDAVVTIQTFYDRIHPDDREPTRAAIESSIGGRTSYDVDYRTVHPDTGAVTWVRAIGRTFYAADGTPIRFDGVTLDVSARKEAEASLRVSEERRRLALDAAELGAWHIDPATQTLTTDERFRRIFSGASDPIDYAQAVATVHPDDRERVLAAIAAATRTDDPAPYAEAYRVIHRDGSVRWVFAKGGVNHDRNDPRRLVSFDGTLADITERKRIEDERERLLSQLRDQDRRKDEFLATLAHELRNPLAPIRNGLQVIRMAGAEGTVEQARSMMERQLTQMTRLVDDLLDVSRVTTGKLELRRERLELHTVVTAALETSLPVIEQHGHDLAIEVPDEPVFVDGDPIRLAQIVANLLTNSAKYTHCGGHIRLTVARDGAEAAVTVADDGIGIPPEMLDSVFGMFTQVDRTLEKTTGGLGIGLSLVKGLVEMHGGTIEARSEGEGRGSEFTLRLPVARSVPGDVPERHADVGQDSPVGPRRILVVDDNVDSADSLGQLLEMMGNEVRTAYDGAAGLEAAREFRPCLVLCDIGMPKVNGYDTARSIRAEAWGKDTVLVALTGWSQQEDVQRSAEAGFDHHLVKPVDTDALCLLLAQLEPVTA